jgi:hypothetical protein
MTLDYFKQVVSHLETEFGCKGNKEILDGPYPMRINGQTDIVVIEGDSISVNNIRLKRPLLNKVK